MLQEEGITQSKSTFKDDFQLNTKVEAEEGRQNKNLYSDDDMARNRQEDLIYLRMMCEIFIFHASQILLLKRNERKDIYGSTLVRLIKEDNVLPVEFCLEIFFKYGMLEEALYFLFHRKEYKELLGLIKRRFVAVQKDKEHRKFWARQQVKFSEMLLEVKTVSQLSSEEFILQQCEWFFRYDKYAAIDCLKRKNVKEPIQE